MPVASSIEPRRNRAVAEFFEKGTWVEIHRIVLPADRRAPQLPEDSRRVPFEMRVKGFLTHAARIGDEAEIVTSVGRRLTGRLTEIDPAYEHGFGRPVRALSSIGSELREILGRRRQRE